MPTVEEITSDQRDLVMALPEGHFHDLKSKDDRACKANENDFRVRERRRWRAVCRRGRENWSGRRKNKIVERIFRSGRRERSYTSL